MLIGRIISSGDEELIAADGVVGQSTVSLGKGVFYKDAAAGG